jgi:hypothetical protein
MWKIQDAEQGQKACRVFSNVNGLNPGEASGSAGDQWSCCTMMEERVKVSSVRLCLA